MSAILEGQRIAGRYRISRPIGRGGMASVYLAHDEKTGRPVAVKVLHEAYAADPDGRRRFSAEARVAAKLRHPAIARVLDSVDGDPPAIVYEYIDGPTLKDYLRERGPLPVPLVAAIVSQIAQALDYAHAAGVIHRDIKPGNVLLVSPPQTGPDEPTSRLPVPSEASDERPAVKVIDFGIARAVGSGDVTTRGIVLGSASYLAPEQASGQSASPASDVYALGVVAYELLAGRPPFQAENHLAILTRKLHEAAPDPRIFRPDLPAGVVAAVAAALARDPNRRPASAGEFGARLRQAAGLEKPVTAPRPAVVTPIGVPGGPAKRPIRKAGEPRRRIAPLLLLLAAGVAGLLLLLGAVALGARSDSPVENVAPSPARASQPAERPIPQLVGLSFADAKRRIEESGFQLAEVREEPGTPAGVVLDQEPDGGEIFPAGNGINLTLAAGATKPAGGSAGGAPAAGAPASNTPAGNPTPPTSNDPPPQITVAPAGGVAERPPVVEDRPAEEKKPPKPDEKEKDDEKDEKDEKDNEKQREGPRRKDD